MSNVRHLFGSLVELKLIDGSLFTAIVHSSTSTRQTHKWNQNNEEKKQRKWNQTEWPDWINMEPYNTYLISSYDRFLIKYPWNGVSLCFVFSVFAMNFIFISNCIEFWKGVEMWTENYCEMTTLRQAGKQCLAGSRQAKLISFLFEMKTGLNTWIILLQQ